MTRVLQVDGADIVRGQLLRADLAAGRLASFDVVTLQQADAFGFVIACLADAEHFARTATLAAAQGVPLTPDDTPEHSIGGAPSPPTSYRRTDSGTPLSLPDANAIYLAPFGAARLLYRASVPSSSAPDWEPIAGAPGESGGPIALPSLPAGFPTSLPGIIPSADLGALPVLGIIALTVAGVAAIAGISWYGVERHKANVGLQVETMRQVNEYALRATAVAASIQAGRPVDPSLVTMAQVQAGEAESRVPYYVAGGALALAVATYYAVSRRAKAAEELAKWGAR